MRANNQLKLVETVLNNIDNIKEINIKNNKYYKIYYNNIYKCIYNYYIDFISSEKEAYKLFKTDEEIKRTKANYESKKQIMKNLLIELNNFNKSNTINKNNIIQLFELFKDYSIKCCVFDYDEILNFMKLFIN